MSSFSATILSDADVVFIINSAKTRSVNDTKYSDYLLTQLVEAAANANLKERFSKAVYEKRRTTFMLCDLHTTQTFKDRTFRVEDIINEYNTLEKLSTACGRHVQSYYEICGKNIQIYLEFIVPQPTQPMPIADEALLQRRYEKETSW